MTCPFCEILRDDAKDQIVFRTPLSIIIRPLRPKVLGHLLVIPREHQESLHQLDPYTLGGIMGDVASVVATHYPCNVIQSNGAAATQTVFHVHFHIIPRRPNDGLKETWPWS